jgi:hypothetical protein
MCVCVARSEARWLRLRSCALKTAKTYRLGGLPADTYTAPTRQCIGVFLCVCLCVLLALRPPGNVCVLLALSPLAQTE